MNIIITKDPYDFQYGNSNCLVITKHITDPVILTRRNVMKFFRFKHDIPESIEKNGKTVNTPEISSYLLPFIYAIMGDKKRSVPGIKGYGPKKVYNDLVKLYEIGYIFDEDPETMSCSNLCKIMTGGDTLNRFNDDNGKLADLIGKYYRCFDIPYQIEVASKDQLKHITSHLKNKSDPQGLRDINDKYFDEFPLKLMELARYSSKYDTDLYNSLE
jgi:5'-3' exonuclease